MGETGSALGHGYAHTTPILLCERLSVDCLWAADGTQAGEGTVPA